MVSRSLEGGVMTKQYLVRAELAFGFQECVPTSTPLPAKLGPFQMDRSPNAGLYLAGLGLIESHQISRDNYDSKFPMSLLYLEHNYTFSNDENPTKHADDVLDRLESLLRLFQPGEVSVLRHGVWHIDAAGELTPAWSFSGYAFKPVKPPIEGLHEYGDYPLDDATLESLVELIDRFWDVLDVIAGNLKIAMARLSSSYEKRDLADRLIDLVIALEALFGGGGSSAIAKNLANRSAWWLHTNETERCAAFKTIKKPYRYRNKVVHGNLGRDLPDDRVNELEGMVRSSIRTFLDWKVCHGTTPSGPDIDGLIKASKVL